jgi:1-(5-phosphoribosyl)-5-[(5-phosphoribosylamino)methylideneamino] imidazole-4-carboxamide isomerase/N-(5'phosphoribosyl)anthranilate isomerase
VSHLVLLPAVDVAGGRAVRPARAGGGDEVVGDPLRTALELRDAGAEWLHVVDLDAAFGRGGNRELLAEIVRRLDVPVQLSGGVRDDETLEAALATGCARVNVAASALDRLDWVADVVGRYGDRVTVAVDVRGTRLEPRGSTGAGGVDWAGVVDRLDAAGCRRYVVTDVERDGTLHGPNLRLLADVVTRTGGAVVASGGVASLDDLRAIAAAGVEAAVVGKALYVGAFTLPEALAALRADAPVPE